MQFECGDDIVFVVIVECVLAGLEGCVRDTECCFNHGGRDNIPKDDVTVGDEKLLLFVGENHFASEGDGKRAGAASGGMHSKRDGGEGMTEREVAEHLNRVAKRAVVVARRGSAVNPWKEVKMCAYSSW